MKNTRSIGDDRTKGYLDGRCVFRSDCSKGSVESLEYRSQWMSLVETDEEWGVERVEVVVMATMKKRREECGG